MPTSLLYAVACPRVSKVVAPLHFDDDHVTTLGEEEDVGEDAPPVVVKNESGANFAGGACTSAPTLPQRRCRFAGDDGHELDEHRVVLALLIAIVGALRAAF
jgi:hypothetical protein